MLILNILIYLLNAFSIDKEVSQVAIIGLQSTIMASEKDEQ